MSRTWPPVPRPTTPARAAERPTPASAARSDSRSAMPWLRVPVVRLADGRWLPGLRSAGAGSPGALSGTLDVRLTCPLPLAKSRCSPLSDSVRQDPAEAEASTSRAGSRRRSSPPLSPMSPPGGSAERLRSECRVRGGSSPAARSAGSGLRARCTSPRPTPVSTGRRVPAAAEVTPSSRAAGGPAPAAPQAMGRSSPAGPVRTADSGEPLSRPQPAAAAPPPLPAAALSCPSPAAATAAAPRSAASARSARLAGAAPGTVKRGCGSVTILPAATTPQPPPAAALSRSPPAAAVSPPPATATADIPGSVTSARSARLAGAAPGTDKWGG